MVDSRVAVPLHHHLRYLHIGLAPSNNRIASPWRQTVSVELAQKPIQSAASHYALREKRRESGSPRHQAGGPFDQGGGGEEVDLDTIL